MGPSVWPGSLTSVCVFLCISPPGFELLYQPEVVRLYLSLLTESQNYNTLEAAAGALQNLSAGQWTVSPGLGRVNHADTMSLSLLVYCILATSVLVIDLSVTEILHFDWRTNRAFDGLKRKQRCRCSVSANHIASLDCNTSQDVNSAASGRSNTIFEAIPFLVRTIHLRVISWLYKCEITNVDQIFTSDRCFGSADGWCENL